MRRHSSRTCRVLYGLTALVTVWCLGCAAFDPLLDGLFGPQVGAGMLCASDNSSYLPSATTLSTAREDAPEATAAPADGSAPPSGLVCGCQSCYAPAPALFAVAPDPPPSPRALVFEPSAPASIEREPLVPPPQRTL